MQLSSCNLHTTLFPEFFERVDEFVRRRGTRNGGCLKKIFFAFIKKRTLVSILGQTEADGFLKKAEKYTKPWIEAGVELVLHGYKDKFDEELLECKPTRRVRVDNDSD